MDNELLKITKQLLKMVKASEWETRHAAENKYCPYYANDNDMWRDQEEHHAGCKYVATVKKAEKIIDKFSS